jgi:hypothetical protein
MKKLVLCAMFVVGCTHHVRIDFPNTMPSPNRQKHWVNGWLWHLVGGETNVAHYCGDQPVHRIDVRKSFGNHLVSWLTLGIYTPMHVTVQCAERPAQPQIMMVPHPGYAPPPGAVYAPPPPPPPGYVPPPGQ